MLLGPDDSNFLKLQQIADVANGLLYRAQRFLDDPEFSFAAVAGKVYSAVRSFVRMLLLVGTFAVAAVGIALLYKVSWNPNAEWTPFKLVTDLANNLVNPRDRFLTVLAVIWCVTAGVMLGAYARRIYLRFGDVDD
jgi:hypothetical protein